MASGRKTNLTGEEKAKRDRKIVAAWNAGVSAKDLKTRFGISAESCTRIIKEARDRGERVREHTGSCASWPAEMS